MFKRLTALTLLLGAAAIGPAKASSVGIEEFMGFTDLSYSGYATYQSWDMSIEGPINRAPGEMRFEFTQQGVAFTGLVQRGDEDLILILPEHGQYTRLEGGSSDAMIFVPRPSYYQAASITPEGWDQWNGQTAVRNRIEGIDEQGRVLDGQLWNAPNGVLLRAVLNIGERERAVVYELTEYVEEPQKFSTFLVPEGFTDMNAVAEAEPDPEPEVVEALPAPSSTGSGATTGQDLKEAQNLLNGLGYDAGPADGLYGPRTRSAISLFQRGHDLIESGSLNRATLVVLRDVAARSTASGGEESGSENDRDAAWQEWEDQQNDGSSGSAGSGGDNQGQSSSRSLTEEGIQAIATMLRLSGMNETQVQRRIQQMRNSQ